MTSENDNAFSTGTNNFSDIFGFINYFFKVFKGGYTQLNFSAMGFRASKLFTNYLRLPLTESLEEFKEQMIHHSADPIKFGAAPRFMTSSNTRKSGADESVAEIGCIWSEIEYRKTKGGLIDALEKIHGPQLRPSLMVDSGTARQIYYLLKEPLKNSKLLEWKTLTRKLDKILEISSTISSG